MEPQDRSGRFQQLMGQLEDFYSALLIRRVPSYANSIFYSFGFLLMVCFAVLALTGIVMLLFGPEWWGLNPMGVYVRSIHLWAAQAFAFFLVLHAFVVFSTSAYRSKGTIIWMLGSLLLFISLIQIEFGYGLRSDFSTQWRALQGADFWNGAGLGYLINPLSFNQVLGIHAVIFPFIMLVLIFVHFSLVKLRGIATPYRNDIEYEMVEADHRALYLRGAAVVAVILVLALLSPSPFVPPISIQQMAQSQPSVMATTLISEFNQSSGTATYLDSIDPYTYSTSSVYVTDPYNQYLSINPGANALAAFNSENSVLQQANLAKAQAYFANNGTISARANASNPLIPLFSSLVIMGRSGLYEAYLRSSPGSTTYVLRFMSDTGVLDAKAEELGITLGQYGMIKDESGWWPPNSWWLTPLAVLDNTVLVNSQTTDRDGAIIMGLTMLLFIAVPVIPFINEIPDRLGLYKLFWKLKKDS